MIVIVVHSSLIDHIDVYIYMSIYIYMYIDNDHLQSFI